MRDRSRIEQESNNEVNQYENRSQPVLEVLTLETLLDIRDLLIKLIEFDSKI